ncbi:GDSL esterase/lipase [Nymphaea thermarum]|nr:GDSL esterase/lipase [Nymphaea thermarum]
MMGTFLSFMIFLPLLWTSQLVSGQLVPAIITFGDSAVDVGNNNHLYTLVRANFPPYGRDFVTHSPTGRFCNGKLVTDFTAESLGFASYPPAYLSPQGSGKNLLIGANFASASSGLYERTAALYNAIPLSRQLGYYREYQTKLHRVAGKATASSIISQAIYILSAGSSDFIQNYYINPLLNRAYIPAQFSDVLVQSFSSFVQELYGLGARRIGVTSLPPLGCLPASITLFGLGSNDCIERLNTDALSFNRKLHAAARALRNGLPELKIVVFDIYAPLYDLVTNPLKQGFSEARRACCGTGTIETSLLCNANAPGTCSNATSYVFWDSFHPSEAANQLLANALLLQGISLIS